MSMVTSQADTLLQPTHNELWPAILAHLMRGGEFGYYWTITGENKITSWFQADKPLPVPDGCDHVYYGVNPTNARGKPWQRAKIQDIAAVNCLFAEFDGKHFEGGLCHAYAHVMNLPVKPSVIVDSGGGFHAYWLLREPFIIANDADRQHIRQVQANWVQRMGGDPGAKDIARVLRVPGTVNYKPQYGPDYPTVSILEANLNV